MRDGIDFRSVLDAKCFALKNPFAQAGGHEAARVDLGHSPLGRKRTHGHPSGRHVFGDGAESGAERFQQRVRAHAGSLHS